jgi:hypothetical protein
MWGAVEWLGRLADLKVGDELLADVSWLGSARLSEGGGDVEAKLGTGVRGFALDDAAEALRWQVHLAQAWSPGMRLEGIHEGRRADSPLQDGNGWGTGLPAKERGPDGVLDLVFYGVEEVWEVWRTAKGDEEAGVAEVEAVCQEGLNGTVRCVACSLDDALGV